MTYTGLSKDTACIDERCAHDRTDIKMEVTIKERIRSIQKRIEELLERFPAHSIPQTMLIELDELEEELNTLMREANSVEGIENIKLDNEESK